MGRPSGSDIHRLHELAALRHPAAVGAYLETRNLGAAWTADRILQALRLDLINVGESPVVTDPPTWADVHWSTLPDGSLLCTGTVAVQRKVTDGPEYVHNVAQARRYIRTGNGWIRALPVRGTFRTGVWGTGQRGLWFKPDGSPSDKE